MSTRSNEYFMEHRFFKVVSQFNKSFGGGWVVVALFLTAQMGCTKAESAHSAQDPKIVLIAQDSVPVTAKIYKVADSTTWIVLCHQAGYSRGEYKEIAPKLNQLGFNCLALDQRSGDEVNGIPNETAKAAQQLGKPTDYLAAEQDIIAAVDYARKQDHGKVILLGSSYSASLALKIAAEHPNLVLAVIAFSPGEYFDGKLDLHEAIEHLKTPSFVTGPRKEAGDITKLLRGHAAAHCVQFVPHGDGIHGASALWASNPSNDEYWQALKVFLKKYQ